MKQLFSFILIFLTLYLSFGFSQTVNEIPIKDINTDYIKVKGIQNFGGNKIILEIDFGQESKTFSSKNKKLYDKNGKPMEFNSMVDALNYLSKVGYEYADGFKNSSDDPPIYSYLLKKKTKD
jgi:hypothetical protein